MRVLITGAAGYIGRHLTRGLAAGHELRLGDTTPVSDRRFVHVDVLDPASVAQAMQDMEAVVHLAVASGHEGEYEDDAFNQKRFDVNVRGVGNVLEAARRAGVRRVVHTSSLMVVWGYEAPAWVASDAPPRPVGTYALTKRLGEEICAYYAILHRMSILCLRIPKPVDIEDPAWKQRRLRPQWIAFPELVDVYRRGLEAPGIGFEIVTVVGESSQRRWDLAKAERVLGYKPRCRLEDMGYTVGRESEPYADG